MGRWERRCGYRLWIGGPVPPGADAWTVGSVVVVRSDHATSEHLLAHELEHVRQYRERGFLGFVIEYLHDYLSLRLSGWGHKAAYRRIPAEVTAEWRARRRMHLGCD